MLLEARRNRLPSTSSIELLQAMLLDGECADRRYVGTFMLVVEGTAQRAGWVLPDNLQKTVCVVQSINPSIIQVAKNPRSLILNAYENRTFYKANNATTGLEFQTK